MTDSRGLSSGLLLPPLAYQLTCRPSHRCSSRSRHFKWTARSLVEFSTSVSAANNLLSTHVPRTLLSFSLRPKGSHPQQRTFERQRTIKDQPGFKPPPANQDRSRQLFLFWFLVSPSRTCDPTQPSKVSLTVSSPGSSPSGGPPRARRARPMASRSYRLTQRTEPLLCTDQWASGRTTSDWTTTFSPGKLTFGGIQPQQGRFFWPVIPRTACKPGLNWSGNMSGQRCCSR
jgi:hypothetical protein